MRSTRARVGFVAVAALIAHRGFAFAQPVPALGSEAVSSPLSTPTTASAAASSPSFPGFLLGARLGLGELHFRLGNSNTWGRSYPIEAWAGGAVNRRLVLFVQIYHAHVFNPSSSYGELRAFNLLGFGPGLRYYLTPSHLYLSASLLFSQASFSGPDRWGGAEDLDEHTQWGATGRLALGKEWQVSPSWRLGIEGDALFGRMDYQMYGFDKEESTVRGFSLLFSATHHLPGDERFAVPAYSVKPHTRRGLYLDAHLGVGKLDGRFGDYPASGTIFPVGLAAGWSVTQRLVLFGGFSHGHIPSLDCGYSRRCEADLDSFGPGLKYYLTSSNLFLSSSVELARIDFDDDSSDDMPQSHRGFVVRLAYGKEWWLSNRWGIGLAGELMLGRLHYGDEGADSPGATYMPQQLSLFASATYNHAPGDEADTSPTDATGAPLPASEHHTHDGFYAGVRLGVGWLKLTRSGTDSTISGWGQPFALSAGFAVTPHLILFGEFYGAQVRNPKSDWASHLVDFDLLGFGPGARYYLMPSNLFASCTVLVSEVGFRDESPSDWRYGTDIVSNWGVTGRLSIGKEIWVSSNWGLGIAGELLLGWMKESEFDNSLTVRGLSVLASASFN